jgi:hypothetical protein
VALVAVPVLAPLAGCVGNARAVLLKRGWLEPAVVWGVTIGESGTYKSPAFHAAVSPLWEIEIDRYDAYHREKEEYEVEMDRWKKQPREERLELPEPAKPEEPPAYVTGDTTIEALAEQLGRTPKGLLVARDELDGWFQSFCRYKGKGGGSDRPNLLELSRAGTLAVDRKSRPDGRLLVRRACASVTGTIQPGVVARAFNEEAMDAGLAARFLLAMPPRRRRAWSERDLPDDLTQRYQELIKALLDLAPKDIARRSPHVLGLSALAKVVWLSCFRECAQVQFMSEGAQQACYAKIEAYASRLVLVHHCRISVDADESDLRAVLQPSMEAGVALAKWFAGEATRVYAMLHEDEDSRQTRRLVEWVMERGERVPGRPDLRRIGPRDLQRSNSRRWPTRESAEAELDALVGLGLGRGVEGPAREGDGRRSRWFEMSCPTSDVSDNSLPDDGPASETPSDISSGGGAGPSRPGDTNGEESMG